jgi:hypothetical protein
MNPTRQILCMKWGSLYGPEYVNRLYAMVVANLDGPVRFVCLTDDMTGIRPEVECQPCPTIDLPAPHCLRGWRKLTTFAGSDALYGLDGVWLFLDLDVVVTGHLEDFFTFRADADFVVMQNWTQPGEGIGNTSVYRFRVGALDWLLSKLIGQQREILNCFNNSQTFISRTLGDLAFWPDDWCVLFKTHCVPPWPQRFWREPILPQGARVVAFPGVPNPHEAAEGRWPAQGYKRLYKVIRPTRWIKDTWDRAERTLVNSRS